MEDPLERAEFHRWEGDNLRMVWACFVRQAVRPEYSNDLQIFRLKQRWLIRRATPRDLPALPAPSGAAPALLAALPDFPVELDCFDELELKGFGELDIEDEEVDVEARKITIMFEISDSETETAPPPLPPPEAHPPPLLSPVPLPAPLLPPPEAHPPPPLLEPPLPLPAPALKAPPAVFSEPPRESPPSLLLAVGPLESLVAAEDDGFLPLPESFFDELPPPLEIGLDKLGAATKRGKGQKRQKRPAPLENVDGILAELQAEEKKNAEYVPKVHADKVQKMKKPAAAKPVAAPAAAKAAAAKPAAAPLLKRPAALLAAAELAESRDVAEMCPEFCTDERMTELLPGKLQRTWQRKTYHVQVVAGGKVRVQATDKQLQSTELADAAGDVLLGLWNSGVTSADLQRCKLAGALFGMKCGKASAKSLQQ